LWTQLCETASDVPPAQSTHNSPKSNLVLLFSSEYVKIETFRKYPTLLMELQINFPSANEFTLTKWLFLRRKTTESAKWEYNETLR